MPGRRLFSGRRFGIGLLTGRCAPAHLTASLPEARPSIDRSHRDKQKRGAAADSGEDRGAQRGTNPWQAGEGQPATGYSRTSPQGYEGATLKLVKRAITSDGH